MQVIKITPKAIQEAMNEAEKAERKREGFFSDVKFGARRETKPGREGNRELRLREERL